MHRGSCGDSMFAPLVQASTLPDVLSAVVANFSHLHEIIWVIVGCIFSILHLNSLSKTKVCQIWLDPPQSQIIGENHAIPCHTINQEFHRKNSGTFFICLCTDRLSDSTLSRSWPSRTATDAATPKGGLVSKGPGFFPIHERPANHRSFPGGSWSKAWMQNL